jgi:site-specific DNA-adenine methylase
MPVAQAGRVQGGLGLVSTGVKVIAPYKGGKGRLRSQIVPYLGECRTYHEPFCGLASVFLAHGGGRVLSILNDANPRTINLLRQIQNHPYRLARLIERSAFPDIEALKRCWEVDASPLVEARNYYAICKGGYSGGGGRWAGLSASKLPWA